MSDDTEFDAPPITAPVSLERTPLIEQEGPAAELYAHEEARIAFGMDPVDGLPRPVVESSFERQQVVALSPDTFVCMADRRTFILYAGHQETGPYEAARFDAREVSESNGAYYVPPALAIERVALRPEQNDHLRARYNYWKECGRVEVHPIRKQCKHYVRQLVDFPQDPEHQLMTRMCTAQRSETGEYVSVREALVFACELRDPRDRASEKKLDEFDDNKIRLGLLRSSNGSEKKFDIDEALAAEAKNDPSGERPHAGEVFRGGILAERK